MSVNKWEPSLFNTKELCRLIIVNKVSLNKVAIEAEVDVGSLCKLRSGKCKHVYFSTVVKLARYFNEPIDIFILKESA